MASPLSLRHLLFLLLLLCPSPSLSSPLPYAAQCRTLLSLAHSLASRVANLRAARGDSAGAERARLFARSLDRGLGLGFWKLMWSAGSDYLRHYAWRGAPSADLLGAVADLNRLLGSLGELARIRSDRDRAAWVQRNYRNVLRVSSSLVNRFLSLFRQPGPLREAVEMVQREVVEGQLLRDCLELGSNDLGGLIVVLKDLALHFSSGSAGDHTDL